MILKSLQNFDWMVDLTSMCLILRSGAPIWLGFSVRRTMPVVQKLQKIPWLRWEVLSEFLFWLLISEVKQTSKAKSYVFYRYKRNPHATFLLYCMTYMSPNKTSLSKFKISLQQSFIAPLLWQVCWPCLGFIF